MEIQLGLMTLEWVTGPVATDWNLELMELQWTTGPMFI